VNADATITRLFERVGTLSHLVVTAADLPYGPAVSLSEDSMVRAVRSKILGPLFAAQQAAQAISDGYGQGRYTLLEVLDAQASVAQTRLREQEALQNFHVAVAIIEGLVGNPFSLARESPR